MDDVAEDATPWLIDLNQTDGEALRLRFISPFVDGNGISSEATTLPAAAEGKDCLECLQGEWLLMVDGDTKECILFSIDSHAVIPLPPLLEPLGSLHRCAMAAPSTSPNDCAAAVVFASYGGAFLLYCRPGDERWTKRHLHPHDGDEFMGTIFASDEKFYVHFTGKSSCMLVDAAAAAASSSSSSSAVNVRVEKEGVAAEPPTYPLRRPCSSFWVSSDGAVFLVRLYRHCYHSFTYAVTDVDVHRLDAASGHVWRKVESIGGATFFLGSNCVAVASAAAGTQPDCIHCLLYSSDGVRLYTVRLDARTISFRLLTPASSCRTEPSSSGQFWCSYWRSLYWVIPRRKMTDTSVGLEPTELSSFKQQPSESLYIITSKLNGNLALKEDTEEIDSSAPWSHIPIDLLESLAPKLSFIDCIHAQAVCKTWSSMTSPILGQARTYPMLMSLCSKSSGAYRLFDPMNEKEYTVKNSSLCSARRQTLRFSKHGWVLLTRGHRRILAVNPFTGEELSLPRMRRQMFNGISFSSVPSSPDSVIFAICKESLHDYLEAMLWRAGDRHWTRRSLPCDAPFYMTLSNPIFFEEEFYCLGAHGNLGVFNPDDLTWRVLDKPEPVHADPAPAGDRFCCLLEFRGDLIAVFRPYDARPIEMFRLDRPEMSWVKMERLDGSVMFLDNGSASMRTVDACQEEYEYGFCCNRVYLPMTGFSEAGDGQVSVFYDLEDGEHRPAFDGLVEPINSIWVEPIFSQHRICI